MSHRAVPMNLPQILANAGCPAIAIGGFGKVVLRSISQLIIIFFCNIFIPIKNRRVTRFWRHNHVKERSLVKSFILKRKLSASRLKPLKTKM